MTATSPFQAIAPEKFAPRIAPDEVEGGGRISRGIAPRPACGARRPFFTDTPGPNYPPFFS